MEALENQFPIVNLQRPLCLIKPKDYADALAIHTNYLNRMVKNTTGKTTSEFIAERVFKGSHLIAKANGLEYFGNSFCLGF